MKPGYISFLVLITLLLPPGKTETFSKGPYTHQNITIEAIERFEDKHGLEIDALCSQEIVYQSASNDYLFPKASEHHCDNNDIAGCSWKLNQLYAKANRSILLVESMNNIGRSLHVVHDFYAHSNWPEAHKLSFILPPTDLFNGIAPPPYLQTGLYPDFFPEDFQAQYNCFLTGENEWANIIYGATHACMGKDQLSGRGAALVEGTVLTYHWLAAEYAIRHSVKLLERFHDTNANLKLCTRMWTGLGCNIGIIKGIERQRSVF